MIFIFWKNYGNVQKHSEKRKKMKLFGMRTKCSYYKVYHRKFVSYSIGKNSNTHE